MGCPPAEKHRHSRHRTSVGIYSPGVDHAARAEVVFSPARLPPQPVEQVLQVFNNTQHVHQARTRTPDDQHNTLLRANPAIPPLPPGAVPLLLPAWRIISLKRSGFNARVTAFQREAVLHLRTCNEVSSSLPSTP